MAVKCSSFAVFTTFLLGTEAVPSAYLPNAQRSDPPVELNAAARALLNVLASNQHLNSVVNWSSKQPLYSWSHVETDTDGNVTALRFNDVDIEVGLLELAPLLTPTLKTLELNKPDHSKTQGVTGDIELLSFAPNLEDLWLFGQTVTGDISTIASLERLRIAGLYQTSIYGSIEEFGKGKCKNLAMLVAAETSLQGNIDVSFTADSTPFLTKLNLLKVKNLHGSIERLVSSFPRLEALGLSDSPFISGDVSAFFFASLLTDLRLWNTKVSGDVAVLRNLPRLEGVNLHNTKVSGDASFLESCCENIRELHLWGTETTGDSERLREAGKARDQNIFVDWPHVDAASGQSHLRNLWPHLLNDEL